MLRPLASTKSAKPPPSPQKSPIRRTPAKSKPTEDSIPIEPKTPSLSIREQIALKRAEAKKAASTSKGIIGGSSLDELDGLEDALPPLEKPQEDIVDLGRWSVKETIERARSSGEYYECCVERVAMTRCMCEHTLPDCDYTLRRQCVFLVLIHAEFGLR
jgi:hypothetical protein